MGKIADVMGKKASVISGQREGAVYQFTRDDLLESESEIIEFIGDGIVGVFQNISIKDWRNLLYVNRKVQDYLTDLAKGENDGEE